VSRRDLEPWPTLTPAGLLRHAEKHYATEELQAAFVQGYIAGRLTKDAFDGQDFQARMAQARASRGASNASERHADWQVRAERLWRQKSDRTAGKVAELILGELVAEGADPLPATKTIQNHIRKPQKVSRAF